MTDFKVFMAALCCACAALAAFFYVAAMNSDDAEGFAVWGAAVTVLATMASGVALSILTIVSYLR